MSKKQKLIFLITFVTVGLIILGIFFWLNRPNQITPTEDMPWYQQFNPFGTSSNSNNITDSNGIDIDNGGTSSDTKKSRLFQISDFAVSGFSYQDYSRAIEGSDQAKEVSVLIDSNTKEGRAKIQQFLNKNIDLEKPLVEDGNFGNATTEAIKKFQQKNNLPLTGKLDTTTSKYFTETKTIKGELQYEKIPSVKYVERKNGHIYQTTLKDLVTEKVSNSTIPGIYEAFFNNTGDTVIYRYLSEDSIINTFLATMGKPSGQYLPANIIDISLSKNKTRFFYLIKSNNTVQGIVRNFETGLYQNVFNHQLTEWLSDWDANDNIYLTTKASYVTTGAMYQLNTTNKTITKVLGGILGLTTKISPDGKKVLYSISSETGPRLMVYSIKDNSSVDLDTYGLPEKCTWSQNNIMIYCAAPNVVKGKQYPDVWYQGIVSFDDFFVMIDTNTKEVFSMANSADETPIDAISPALDNDENYLLFINKKDYTLWGLNLK